MNRTVQYNQALMDIKSKIKSNPTAMEDIKFCCSNIDGFSANDLERIHTMTDLYRKLQELDMLSEDNTGFLKGLLASNNFNACVAILERYTVAEQSTFFHYNPYEIFGPRYVSFRCYE